MARRIQWGFLLLVVVGFVAPGAADASGVGAARAPVPAVHASSAALASGNGHRADYAPVVVRAGGELEEGRSERGGGLKRGFDGATPTSRPASPCSSPVRCAARGGGARSFSFSTVALRAPPPITA